MYAKYSLILLLKALQPFFKKNALLLLFLKYFKTDKFEHIDSDFEGTTQQGYSFLVMLLLHVDSKQAYRLPYSRIIYYIFKKVKSLICWKRNDSHQTKTIQRSIFTSTPNKPIQRRP